MGARRVFSGSFLVISVKSETEVNLLPGEVGLYLLIPIFILPCHSLSAQRAFEKLYTVPRRQGNYGLLASRGVSRCPTLPLGLRGDLDGVDRGHFNLEDLLH